MAAGRGGATAFLKDALAKKDIFIRKNIPVEIYQTQRNATVRTAQALHLSDWIFGIKVQSASQQGAGETENLAPTFFEDEIGRFEYDAPKAPIVKAVGERVEIDLAASPFASTYDKVKWTIPGRFVRGYDGRTTDAKLFELEGADLERPRLSFFWVDAGSGRTVTARITTKDGTEHEWALAFDVEGPTVNSFTKKVGETQIAERHGMQEMRFGKPLECAGVRWFWKVTMPPRHAGHIKDVQTVLSDRSQIQSLGAGTKDTRRLVRRNPKKTKLHVQLDGKDSGQPVYSAGLLEASIEAGKSFDNGRGNEDSPGTELPGLAKIVSVNEQFNYFLMFKPETANASNAIWVPIAKAKWSWKSTATQTGRGKWTLKPEKMEPAIDKSTLDFPMYESDVDDNQWLDETDLKANP